jgi:hypothetical protein
MPNIIPAILYKPEKVILLTTKEEYKTAENISMVLNKYDLGCEIFKDYVSAYDLNSVSDAINKIVNMYSEKELNLNITGGTKLMAIAAYEIFRYHKLNIMYCDTFDENIIYFKNGEIVKEKYSNVKISVVDYLRAYGFKPNLAQNKSKKFESTNLLNFIKTHLIEYIKFSKSIRFRNGSKKSRMNNSPKDFELIKKDKEISVTYKQTEIFKSSNSNYQYLIGFWLEDFIYNFIKSNIPNIEIEKNYYILSKSDSPNEIDVIFSKNGKLYLISCKTGEFNKLDLFELEGLRNLAGGTFGKAYLVTLSNVSKSIQMRANEMYIKTLNIEEFMKEIFHLK